MLGPPDVSPRRIEALRALAERGATAGEREAARVALESALRGRPPEPAQADPPPATPARRARARRSQVCRWIKVGNTWAITGPEAALRSGKVKVQTSDRRAREVLVDNVRAHEDLWIADEAEAPATRPAPPRPTARPAARPGQRPSPPYKRPDLLPERFMQCWRLEDMLEELAGAEALATFKAAMQRVTLDEPQRRARLIAEIWRLQKAD